MLIKTGEKVIYYTEPRNADEEREANSVSSIPYEYEGKSGDPLSISRKPLPKSK